MKLGSEIPPKPVTIPARIGNKDSDLRTVITATSSVVGGPPVVLSSGGLTGAWAEENTRESIFAALKRKETFGASGVHLKVRMFAGWDYPKDLTKQPDWLKTAYDKGVPMGSDLPVTTAGGKPTFLVQAIKDPNSGNLDRIQIVKVWTKNGKSQEKEYNVAGMVYTSGRTAKQDVMPDQVRFLERICGSVIAGRAEECV